MIALRPQYRKQYAEKKSDAVGTIIKPFAAIRHTDLPMANPQGSKSAAGRQPPGREATQQKGYRIQKKDSHQPTTFACCGETKPTHNAPGLDPHWHTCLTCGLPVHNTVLCGKVISPDEGVLYCSDKCLTTLVQGTKQKPAESDEEGRDREGLPKESLDL